jgi:hypothetical protein
VVPHLCGEYDGGGGKNKADDGDNEGKNKKDDSIMGNLKI